MKTSIGVKSQGNTTVDLGLRSYFNDVFSRMTTAMLVSAFFCLHRSETAVLVCRWSIVLDHHTVAIGICVGHEFWC
jgi:hypothetical protein